MMVARLGVPWEKNKVMSLNIWPKVSISNRKNDRICDAYLQDVPKLLGDTPFCRGQLIFLEI
jgi:hypothetical protein